MRILSNSSRSYVPMCRQSCITGLAFIILHQIAGSPSWCPASIAGGCQVLYETRLLGCSGQLYQASDRQLAMANWCDHGWYSRAIGSRKDLHEQRGSHHEWWDDQKVPAVCEEAHNILPEKIPHWSIKVGRVQQPGKWQWSAVSPGAAKREEFRRNASVSGCVMTRLD